MGTLWIISLIILSTNDLSCGQEGMSNNVIKVEQGARRHKRSDDVVNYGLTSQEMEDAVNVHNELRRFVNASNMEHMTWNDALASMAAEWAQGCKWGHGQPPMHEDVRYPQLGQNLYYNTGIRNVTHATRRWYDVEVDFYDHATGACSGMCGHYTQLIWAPSREVGCAYHFCETMIDVAKDKVINNAWYFACNYGPAGNVKGKRPYIKGPSCNDCPSGQYWCDKTSPRGLCRRDCDMNNDECECRAECANDGAPDCDCRCSCADGWTEVRCAKECGDYNKHCGKTPGYPEYSCRDATHGDSIKKMCPKLCGVCNEAKDNISLPVQPCNFPEFTTTTQASTTTGSSLFTTADWSFESSPEFTTDDFSSKIPSTSDEVTPTDGFVDGTYVAWIFIESMKPEEIQNVKEVLQQLIADRVNGFCQEGKCCPENNPWISGMSIQKEDVTLTVHSWLNGVTKASIIIRLDHVCSSDNFKTHSSDDSKKVFLSGDLLVSILQDELNNMNSTLHDCCTVSIISVKESDDNEQPENPNSGLSKTWITAVIVIVVNAVLVMIAAAIAFAIKRRMSENEKQATILNLNPVRQPRQGRQQFHQPHDQSFNSSSTYEIPYSHYDIPKSQTSMIEPYLSLDNATHKRQYEDYEKPPTQQHFLYGFSNSQTSI